VSGRAERARCAFSGVPTRLTAALVEAKSAIRVWYSEKNTPHAAAAWRMSGACARHVLSRIPEMDEAHRHAFAPHVSSGYAAQQHAQPVHGQHAQPVTRKNPHCRPHPFPGTPVITPVEAMAARGAGSALRTSLPCAVTRPHTAARSEGEMPYQSTCHDKPCARCGTTLTTSMIVRDALCWHEGARLLANAARMTRAVHPPVFISAQHSWVISGPTNARPVAAIDCHCI